MRIVLRLLAVLTVIDALGHAASGKGTSVLFGERVRELRKAKKLTLRQLAPLGGAGFTYLSRVETGKQNYGEYPSEARIRRLAVALAPDEDELLLLTEKIPEGIRMRFFE